MSRALIGEGIFGLCPVIDDVSVTCWRWVIVKESILGKPIALLDIDSNQAIASVMLPDIMDQVSDNFELKRTK